MGTGDVPSASCRPPRWRGHSLYEPFAVSSPKHGGISRGSARRPRDSLSHRGAFVGSAITRDSSTDLSVSSDELWVVVPILTPSFIRIPILALRPGPILHLIRNVRRRPLKLHQLIERHDL